jgi:hypothetical protein
MVISVDIDDKAEPSGNLYEDSMIFTLEPSGFKSYPSLQQANAAFPKRQPPGWTAAGRLAKLVGFDEFPLAMAVASVIVPEWNVVLYPNHYRFWDRVKLVSVAPFAFDPRLFPEGVPAEEIIGQ